MGISPVTVAWLNQQGHDAKHLAEERLHKLSDREIFDKADKENRIILTTDLDFGEIAVSAEESKISVIIFRQADRTPASINQYLERVINTEKNELEKGVILIVQEERFRLRHLR
jgi:predicted nuclease of predicted toxin-antitoxin system